MNVYRTMKRERIEKYQVKLEDLINYLKNEIKSYNPKVFTKEALLTIDQRFIDAIIKDNINELPSPYQYMLELLYFEDISIGSLIDDYILDTGEMVHNQIVDSREIKSGIKG